MVSVTLKFALLIFCTFLPTRLMAQDVVSASQPADAQSQRIHELVEQLASPSFSEREQATAALLEMGTKALALMKNISHADAEGRYRIGQIIERIETDRFELLSHNFLKDPKPENSHGLAAWEPFCSLVGTSRTSKLLFLDMLRQQPELMSLIYKATQDSAQTTSDANPSSQDLLVVCASAQATKLKRQRLDLEYPLIGDVAAILFAVSKMEGQAPIEVNELLDLSVHSVPVTNFMQSRGYQDALRRLFSMWIPKTHDAMACQAIYIAMYNDLETGAVVARNHLARNLDTRTREESIRCLSRFGNQSDIPALLNLFEDQSLCEEFSVDDFAFFVQGINESNESPPGAQGKKSGNGSRPTNTESDSSNLLREKQRMVYRINDLALATAMMLNGEDPNRIFPNFTTSENFGFENRSVAVPRDEALLEKRQQDIAGWKSQYEAGVAKR